MMKKNLLGAIVIFFVTLAFLLMIDDISKSKNSANNESVKIYESQEIPDLATTDEDE